MKLPNTDTLPYRGTAARGGYSTVEDLTRFAEALLDHRLLSPDSTDLLFTAKVDSGPGARYAYGFEDQRDDEGSGPVGHGGGAPGMNGDLRIYPNSGTVVAVLANLDPPAAPTNLVILPPAPPPAIAILSPSRRRVSPSADERRDRRPSNLRVPVRTIRRPRPAAPKSSADTAPGGERAWRWRFTSPPDNPHALSRDKRDLGCRRGQLVP